jgi:hypothetical protein
VLALEGYRHLSLRFPVGGRQIERTKNIVLIGRASDIVLMFYFVYFYLSTIHSPEVIPLAF